MRIKCVYAVSEGKKGMILPFNVINRVLGIDSEFRRAWHVVGILKPPAPSRPSKQ